MVGVLLVSLYTKVKRVLSKYTHTQRVLLLDYPKVDLNPGVLILGTDINHPWV